jgi:hypothetical protein
MLQGHNYWLFESLINILFKYDQSAEAKSSLEASLSVTVSVTYPPSNSQTLLADLYVLQ